MAKKIAVFVRDRQAEALRMAIGLSLEDDEVHVYIMDCKLDGNIPGITVTLKTMRDLGMRIMSNRTDNSLDVMDNATIARELVHYDSVIPY